MNEAPEKSPRSVLLLAVATVFTAVTLLMAIRARATLQSFRGIYEGFGAPTPPTTSMVLNAPYAWWLLAAASVALFAWIAPKSHVDATEGKRMKLALCALVVVSVCMYGFAAYWLYLPIYAMGQTV